MVPDCGLADRWWLTSAPVNSLFFHRPQAKAELSHVASVTYQLRGPIPCNSLFLYMGG